jgi:hypothetical protein
MKPERERAMTELTESSAVSGLTELGGYPRRRNPAADPATKAGGAGGVEKRPSCTKPSPENFEANLPAGVAMRALTEVTLKNGSMPVGDFARSMGSARSRNPEVHHA